MVYCPKCGKQNEDDGTFCVDCGAELYPTRTSRKQQMKKQDDCFGLPQGGTIAGIVFGVIIIILGLSWALDLDINIWPYIVVILGILIAAGAIYGITKRK